MNFNYIARGSLSVLGCPQTDSTINLVTKYNIGDKLYPKHMARRGILEKIVIKKINVIDYYTYNYKDTMNRLWLEYELMTLAEAQELVADFQERQSRAYTLALRNCSTNPSS